MMTKKSISGTMVVSTAARDGSYFRGLSFHGIKASGGKDVLSLKDVSSVSQTLFPLALHICSKLGAVVVPCMF